MQYLMSGDPYIGWKANCCRKDHPGKPEETRAMLSAKYYQIQENIDVS